MNLTRRIEKIHDHLRHNRSLRPDRSHRMILLTPATLRVRERSLSYMVDDDLRTAYIALQTKSLDDDPDIPYWVKWLLRRIYHHYGWTAMDHDGKSYCKWSFLGIFDTATAARWAAMVPGGSWMELPLNVSLPEETCQFRVHDFPHSSVSHEYRNRRLPLVAVSVDELEQLQRVTHSTDDLVQEYHAKSA